MGLSPKEKDLIEETAQKIIDSGDRLPLQMAISATLKKNNCQDGARRVYLRNLLTREVPKELKKKHCVPKSKELFQDAAANEARNRHKTK